LFEGLIFDMKKVWVEPGCISCRSCENCAPEVFQVTITSQVKQNVDFKQHCALIKEAALKCPVNVIKYEE
jgi:ferredoxin